MQEIRSKYYTYYKKILPNGVTAIVYPREELHTVFIRARLEVGALHEESHENGFAHFIEHLVHRGTKKFPTWENLDSFLNQHSGTANAYTRFEHTQYHGSFPKKYLEQGIEYFSELVLNPLLKQADFEKERSIILDELRRSKDDIDYRIFRLIKDHRYKKDDTSFSFDILGTQKTLEQATVEQLQDFYSRHYKPENLTVFIGGAVDQEETVELIEQYFEASKQESEAKAHFVIPEYNQKKVNIGKKQDIDQTYAIVTFPGLESIDTSYAKRILFTYLESIIASSNYHQSILWKRLRKDLGLVYGIHAWHYDQIYRRTNIIKTSFDDKNLEKIMSEIYDGIEFVKTGSYGQQIFEERKKKRYDIFPMQLDNLWVAMNIIMQYEENDRVGQGLHFEEYMEEIEEATFDDLIALANEIFDWEEAQVGIITCRDHDEIEKRVKASIPIYETKN